MFVLDLAIAIILYYLAKRMASAVEGRLACLVWFANPLCFFGIELLGVPDIAATFLVTVALALLLSRRAVLGGRFWDRYLVQVLSVLALTSGTIVCPFTWDI